LISLRLDCGIHSPGNPLKSGAVIRPQNCTKEHAGTEAAFQLIELLDCAQRPSSLSVLLEQAGIRSCSSRDHVLKTKENIFGK
jgi:hypothetical protein